MIKEVWKPVAGYEGLYEVSNLGRVRSLMYRGIERILILKEREVKGGYLRVELRKEGKRQLCLVHRLVAQAFIPNPDNLPQVNHKDENPKNNCVENLEWCTCKYNVNYGARNQKVSQKNKGRFINRSDISKPVAQYTRELVLIAIYPSASEAARKTGIDKTYICNCCRGVCPTAYSFIWKYINI